MSFNIDLIEQLNSAIKNYKSQETKKCIFNSISDFFYRENYHSDILAYYFSYELVRMKLIDWINGKIKDEKREEKQIFTIRKENYQGDVLVNREDGRRDITIYSKNKANAIVIENKSNNAIDMDHQLVRYVSDLKKNNISVDSIIYLNKDVKKDPDQSKWTKEEKENINKILLSSKLLGKDSITEKLINPVITESEDIRLTALSMEIKILFENLIYGGNSVMESELEEFMKILRKDNNLEDFRKINNLFNNFHSESRDYYYAYTEALKSAKKITDKCRIGKYSANCMFVDSLIIDGFNYGVDFWFYVDALEISLLVRGDYDNWEEICENLQKKMGKDWIFESTHKTGERYCLKNEIKSIDENAVKEMILKVINSFEPYLDK